ncbi:cytoplasmic tRNA 2-thiolation protein 2 isoform X1 [Choloepus didactylus]|uniref:cytoplasmic tRNA 2-thiolation protein 2 isoform X1 n=1 Tax=Choloepus didactylus TaxID=27675 RepID=UPI00189DAD6D|nr:cytoplasmic tRNA 2-thiolation protein 2 isoform X1 [Choloepus didactylus]
MCQVGEDYREPPAEEPPPPRPGREQKCVKCKEGLPVLVIRAGDAFCRDCFKAYYVHKFRAVLGKNRLIFPGEKVLLAWSGGPSSSSMVWQVLEGLSRESAKRLRFVPGVVYVDEGAACGQSPEDRAKTLAEMTSILQAVGFPWHTVALEEVGGLSGYEDPAHSPPSRESLWWPEGAGQAGGRGALWPLMLHPAGSPRARKVFGLPPSALRCFAQELAGGEEAYKAAVDTFIQQQHGLGAEGAGHSPCPALVEEQQSPPRPPPAAQTEALTRLFDSVKTLTAKEELLQALRTHLILHVARAHHYSKVLTGESCTRLAIKLMISLALGRGAFLAWDTGFSDDRHGDVVVARPMRDHTLKEVAFYNHLFAVPSVFTPAIDTQAPDRASIHRLMEAFVLRLQAQFPSTVSTVYRTSEKLAKAPRDKQATDSASRCLLCMCTLDIDHADSATAFGAQTSISLAQAEAPAASCCFPGAGGAQSCCGDARPCGRGSLRAHVAEQLCYGCRVNLKDLPSVDPLPPYILAEAQLRSQRAWVQQEIQECLIEDSEDEVETGRAEPRTQPPGPSRTEQSSPG